MNMHEGIMEEHWFDSNCNPAGGCSYGVGFAISWQNGPFNERQQANGAFVAHVLEAALGRLKFYQSTKFACNATATAIASVNAALQALRT